MHALVLANLNGPSFSKETLDPKMSQNLFFFYYFPFRRLPLWRRNSTLVLKKIKHIKIKHIKVKCKF